MRRLHVATGWAIVMIGLLHMLVTFVVYQRLGIEALWFATSGLAVVLIGALQVLAATAARDLKVVRNVAIGASAAGIALATAFSVLTDWSEPQGPVLIALFAVSAMLTLFGRREL